MSKVEAAWKDKSMFTVTLGEVFKECAECGLGGKGHICIVEGCPSLGHVDEAKYEQWCKEKDIWDKGVEEAGDE